MSVRILLADDHTIVREGLRSLLGKEQDMEVVAESGDGRTTVQLAKKLRPHVVLMDIALPDLNGVEAARQILEEAPGVKVVALSMHSARPFVAGMLAAGASGYLLKKCAAEELVHAIRTVLAGEVYLSPEVARVVIEEYGRQVPANDTSARSILTPRELEVLQLIAEGKSTKEIARKLHVTVRTVEAHRHNVMEKLHLHTDAELTKYAVRQGLTSLEF
jgi:DNA-binding NarL/FixJ family response regulator